MLKYYRRAVTLEMRLTFPQIVFVCWISPQHSIICILGSDVSAAGEGVQTSCCRGRADGPRFQKAAPISIFKIRLCLWWWTHRELLPDSASLIAVISDVFSSCRQLFTLTLSVQQQTKLAAKEKLKAEWMLDFCSSGAVTPNECWCRSKSAVRTPHGISPCRLFAQFNGCKRLPPPKLGLQRDFLSVLSLGSLEIFKIRGFPWELWK